MPELTHNQLLLILANTTIVSSQNKMKDVFVYIWYICYLFIIRIVSEKNTESTVYCVGLNPYSTSNG